MLPEGTRPSPNIWHHTDTYELENHAFDPDRRVEAVIEEFVKNFQTEAPSFVLTRGFFEGKYMLALRLDEQLLDEEGQLARYFSRVIFLLDPHLDEDFFAMQVKKTIRNRDLETRSRTAEMNDTGRDEFASFIEEQFLEFAEQYFGEHPLSKPSTVSS